MTLTEQIAQRIALARATGRAPQRWIATAAIAAEVAENNSLLGLPVEIGAPRSDWGLELVCERPA